MHKLKILATLLLLTISTSIKAQFGEQTLNADNSNRTLVALKNKLLDQNENVNVPQVPVQSAVTVPVDIINLTGRWSFQKNDCIAIFTWDGKKWTAKVDPATENAHLATGEIIAELYPTDTDKLKGRVKVLRKGKFKWYELKYKASLTRIRGNYSWVFWSS